MNLRRPIAAAALAGAALSALAITQAEWEADNSLLPTPSAGSPVYVTAPTAPAPVQDVTGYGIGLDTRALVHDYLVAFDTDVSTFPPGTIALFR